MSKFDYQEMQEYIPETATDEMFVLLGRVKAFAAYVNETVNGLIDKKICAAMLGFKLEENND